MLKVIEYDGNLKGIAQKLNNRKEEISIEVNNAVNDIINDIRKNGNQALINYCRKFDGYQIKDENDFDIVGGTLSGILIVKFFFVKNQYKRNETNVVIKQGKIPVELNNDVGITP